MFKNNDREPAISDDAVKTLIEQNRYQEGADMETMFGMYNALCDIDLENLSKTQSDKIHSAKLLFVNNINLPKENKDELLNFITHSLLYIRTSTGQDALKVVSKIGFATLKTVSVAGKIATLGMGSKVLNNVEKVVNKAMTTDSLELVNVWRIKLYSAFKYAKELEGSSLNKDKHFVDRLNELRKQYEEM
ncbi:hypothetical protein II906_10800 [bacterium]|nr:hypothetical protein [bacterium]